MLVDDVAGNTCFAPTRVHEARQEGLHQALRLHQGAAADLRERQVARGGGAHLADVRPLGAQQPEHRGQHAGRRGAWSDTPSLFS